MRKDKLVDEWLEGLKSSGTRTEYVSRFQIWLEYCKAKGFLETGTEQIEDMKTRRLSTDNTIKYFYDNEIPKFFQWLQKDFRGKNTHKPLSQSSALGIATSVRSFFACHRYTLEIKKDSLPSTENIKQTYEDHAFDIYQLRSMFQCGDLKERTVLSCGSNLWLRSGDFLSLKRDLIELAIKREQELAENEQREQDVLEFEFTTEKESEPCSCHLAKETVELLKDYLKAYPKTSETLFNYSEEALSDLLRRLADKAKITVSGRIRWHCLRKFGITLMHGKVTEPVMKYMTGKHISKDLKTYIQNNRETFKAFKTVEPLISLTRTNGNGASKELAKQLEELKKATMKQAVLFELIKQLTPKEDLAKALSELGKKFGLSEPIEGHKTGVERPETFEEALDKLTEAYIKQDLKRILDENGNGS
jgi:hypothetical protein